MTAASGNPVSSTALQIIEDGMRDVGLLEEGQEPNSDQQTSGMRRLNKIVNYLCTKGIKLFLQEDLVLQPVVGQTTYVMGTGGAVNIYRPRRVIEGYYTDINATKRPLILFARTDYNSLSTTIQQGTITGFFPDKQAFQININLWLTPDATAAQGQVHLVTDVSCPNFVQVTDTTVFPVEWALALEWEFANQVSTGQPEAIVNRAKANAMEYTSALEDWDVEDASTTFQPDPRTHYLSGRKFG